MISKLSGKKDSRGSLYPLYFNQVSFSPKRLFLVKDVPVGSIRGKHAHKKTEQLLICLSGNIEITFFDGKEEKVHHLCDGDVLYERSLTWTTIKFLQENSILLVLSSEEYDEKDYIRNYEEYLSIVQGEK